MLDKNNDVRQKPTEEFIASLREKYQIEAEIDRTLTRKMQRRFGAVYEDPSLEKMVTNAKGLISQYLGEGFEIKNASWLTGGASKIQMAFDFISHIDTDQFKKGVEKRLVVRMEPAESVVETSRVREYEILNAMKGVVPVPECYWLDADGTYFPYPAIVYEFIAGVTKPQNAKTTQVSGIGTTYGPELRAQLSPQFVDMLAKIHTSTPSDAAATPSFDMPEIGKNDSVIKQVNWWRRVWEEDRPVDIPLMEVAFNWLIDNAPPLDYISIVHADFRNGNFLFDEASSEITGILDWELALYGDRHYDLVWTTTKIFGSPSEDGSAHLISGLLSEDDFFKAYQEKSGLTVDRKKLQYYSVYCNIMHTTIMLSTAYRISHGSKTHQDVVIATFSKMGYKFLEELRLSLEEVI